MTAARRRWLPVALLALAAAVRLAHWWSVRELPFVAELAMDSREYDRWAREIAGGDWLGGAAFFQAPLYPYLLAAVYAVAGRSLDLVYVLQIVAAVAGCWALWRAGRELGGEAVGLAACGLAAVYSPFVFHDVQLLKESLAVSLAGFLLWRLVALRRTGPEEGARAVGWCVAGLLLGLLVLLRENALLTLPFLLPCALVGDGAGRALRRVAALLLGVALALAPVAARNLAVAGEPLPTTYQGGVNFWIGNHPGADGTYRPLVPGRQVPAYERAEPVRLAEAALGRELTPGEVSDYWLGRALAWARREPVAFARLQLDKLGLFWSWYEWPDAVDYYWMAERSPWLGFPFLELPGVGLLALAGLWSVRRRLGRWRPALLWIAGWCASVVVFFLFSRYRLPALPAVILLAAVPVAGAARRIVRGRWRRAAVPAGLVAAAFALPAILGYAPRSDLVEYNLGRLAADRGRHAEAAGHYRAALVENPGFLSAAVGLGAAAARSGDLGAALAAYRRAVELGPEAPDAWSGLGGALLATGRPEAAERALDRALALDPASPGALHNRALARLAAGRPVAARRDLERLRELAPDSPLVSRLAARVEEAAASGGDPPR